MGNIVELKKSKTGSSRRKGDEYQDLTALRLALELYIKHQKYQLYIEYEKAGNFDDIVVEQGNHINAYQVKYAVNPNDVYILEDFTDPKSKVYFKKFSDSWVSLKKQRGVLNITLYLLTNRALDAELSGIITDDGYFEQKFIEGKVYKHPREMRKTLQRITQLNDDDFENFLKSFRFQIKRPSLNELAQFIQGNLLDHELGISDRNIYHTLKSIIEDFALNRHEAITPQLLDDIFKKIQREYLLPQRFEVDKNVFIKRESLDAKLDAAIQKIDGDYIIVSGLPGIGKSTSLTAYFDEREDVLKDIVIRYYCFCKRDFL